MVKTLCNFRVKPTTGKSKILLATDFDTGEEYTIGWCGNGQYSHYVLSKVSDPECGQYVYVPHWRQPAPLYESIHRAEMRLIYGQVLNDNS